MIADEINSSLIERAKASLPTGMNLATVLTDILCLGKEAVYRRLRNEVPFSLAEAIVISRKMGISLDKLAGVKISPDALYLLDKADFEQYINIYCNSLDAYTNAFKSLKNSPKSKAETASLTVPPAFYHRYSGLSKLRLFRWMYQHDYDSVGKTYEDMVIPELVVEKELNFVEASENVASAIYIFEESIFMHPVNDIKYFHSIGLLSSDTIVELKAQLHSLINDMETLANHGHYENGNEVLFYLSHINFENSYSIVESDKYNLGAMGVYGINYFISNDVESMTRIHKWIASLKKFSTLISQSGEMQRMQFFSQQRGYIDQLDKIQ
jgi:hypothetical protein